MEDVRDRPRLTEEDASNLALEQFGIRTSSARELPSERDQNFCIASSAGERFVLKVANAGANREELDCQNQAMKHLRRILSTEICPGVYTTMTGQEIVAIAGEHGEHLVRLVSWIPGIPLGEVKSHSPELLESLGGTIGKISSALASFEHPAAQREIAWDLAKCSSVVRQRANCVTDPNRQTILSEYVTDYESRVAHRLPQLRKSVLHNDANDYNVLVGRASASQWEVTGVIDFGDIVYSTTVYELAICLAYAMLDKDSPVEAARTVVASFHQAFPLTNDEVEVVFPLACMRLCTSAAMSAYQRQLDPENEYLSISEQPVWELLGKLRGLDIAAIVRELHSACCQPPGHSIVSRNE